MKHFLILFSTFFFFAINAFTQDSLSVNIILNKNDSSFSVSQEVRLHNFDSYTKASTLHIEAEHISSGTKFNFKYAILEGYCKPILLLDKSIPQGQYAFSYKIQSDFLSLSGKVDGVSKKKEEITYYLLNNEANVEINTTPIDEKGNFNIGKIFIADNVLLGFYGESKKDRRKLSVFLNEPIPEKYYPVDSVTNFLMVNNKNINAAADSALIKYFIRRQNGRLTKEEKIATEEIRVIANKKTSSKLQKYEDLFVSTAFYPTADAISFDGFTNLLLQNAGNLQDFILSNVNGFSTFTDSTGQSIKYRDNIVSYYVDEIREEGFPWFLNPWDIALIRVFKNGNFSSIENGTAVISFYTKRGAFLDENPKGRVAFPISGYTPINFVWKSRL